MFFNNNFYYITLGLQAICVWHCIKSRNEQKWIWLIVFLPIIGCVIYFFSEILSGSDVQSLGTNVGSLLNPGGRVRKLEQQLKFADTFGNRVALADAYLAIGQTEDAISLYEKSLTGVFAENEHAIMQLMIAYEKVGHYKGILPLAKKVSRLPEFPRSQAHIAYAKALAFTGHEEAAEKEFTSMKSRFAAFEPRYHYGLFLVQASRKEEAKEVFDEMLNEAKHLSSRERRYFRTWFDKSKEELKKLENVVSSN